MKFLQEEEFDSCRQFMDASLANKISTDRIKEMWASMPRLLGEYNGYSAITSTKTDTTVTTLVRCQFEKTKMDLALTYNQAHKLIGLFFKPAKSSTAHIEPSYCKNSNFYESRLSVKTGTYILPGTLCIPNNIDNPPVAILLAGSGPNDKDGSIGPNKLLKDIATGLASQGIATFRYDKRTLTYGKELMEQPGKVGINEEVIDDALSAVAMIKNNPFFKKSKIIIIGHSLGAMCAPLIAKQSKDVKAIVLMAGNARPLEDLLFEQYTYLFSLDSIDANEKQDLLKIESQIKRVKNESLLKIAKPEDLPLGLHPYYWQSLNAYNQTDVIQKIKQPVFLMQGERDYQVTMTDFNLWKQVLHSNSKNKFTSYPTLNHLFMPGIGKSKPDEYEKPNNVDEQVIKDISAWIKEF
jgi:dienelactone hydrolase